MKDNVIEFLSESNHIEGVYDGRSLEHAIEAWEFIAQQEELTKVNILETHRILMRSHLTTGNDLGKYRTVEVRIGDRLGLKSHLIDRAMNNWIMRVNEAIRVEKVANKLWPAAISREDHVHYEHIHPFIDGNGRTGRIFLNWERVKLNLPILVIKESERFKYYEWFKV